MKKMMILAMMMVMTISANAMSYNAAKNEALFLSDKMAYELNSPLHSMRQSTRSTSTT